MTARIGYLAALAGHGEGVPLRPPRRVFGAAGRSGADLTPLDDPSLAAAPGHAGTSAWPDALTAAPGAIGARSAVAPAGPAFPEAPGQHGAAGSLELQPGGAGRAAELGPSSIGRVPPGALLAVEDAGTGSSGGQYGSSGAGALAARLNFSPGFPDPRTAERSAIGGLAQTPPPPTDSARPAAPAGLPLVTGVTDGDASGPVDDSRAFTRKHVEVDSGRVGQGPAPHAAGEPWRMPRPGQPRRGRRGAGEPGVVSAGTALAAGTGSVASTGPVDGAGLAAGPSAAELPVATPSAGSLLAGSPASGAVLLPGALRSASPLSAGPLPGGSVPGDTVEAGPSARGPRPMDPAAESSPRRPAPAPLVSAATPLASAVGAASSAAAPDAGAPRASAGRLSPAPRPEAPAADPATPPRLPDGDHPQAQLTPPGRLPATLVPSSPANGTLRPAAPALSIGTIEVTLLPPPADLAPARSAQHEPPRRLSRGLGRRYGQGQA